MKPEREFTLAIGASVLASSMGLLSSNSNFGPNEKLFTLLFITGILFVLHASGTLQFELQRTLFHFGNKNPKVGILNDISQKSISSPVGKVNDPSYWKELLNETKL
jgi:hypothetical protein